MNKVTVVLSLCLLLSCTAECYNILLIFPYPIKSMSMLGAAYVKHLLNAGHEITFITPFPLKIENKKLQQINLYESMERIITSFGSFLNISFIMDNNEAINDHRELKQFSMNVTIAFLKNKDVRKLIEDPTQKFDAVISDFYECQMLSILSNLYECPMIWSYSLGMDWTVANLVGEPSNPAFSGSMLTSNVPPFTFSQRLEELWIQVYATYLEKFVMEPQEHFEYKLLGPIFAKHGKTLPKYEDILYNSSIVFANTHLAAGNIPSIAMNIILIGGFHIHTPVEPLPQDLQKVLDQSKHGFIYFSMGSTFKSKDIPISITNGFLELFGGLKHTVIWKYEGNLPNTPKNVYTLKWAPQHSILAHPNCKLFITHGGLLSSTETLHFGVPIIGIPIFIDQFNNVNKAAANGYAIKVDLAKDLPEKLKPAIDEMLSNDRYYRRAKELSLIFHDRPVSPATELVHWVHHAIKTKGALHLRSPAHLVPWYRKLYLDLFAVAIVFMCLLTKLVKKFSCKNRN